MYVSMKETAALRKYTEVLWERAGRSAVEVRSYPATRTALATVGDQRGLDPELRRSG
jgi:hypothetical protein